MAEVAVPTSVILDVLQGDGCGEPLATYFIVGMVNSAPALMPVGQRLVTVFSRV